jgi:hypothetical protein
VVVPKMRTQLVAARTVAEALAELALAADAPTFSEIAGLREERMAARARLVAGDELEIEEVSDAADGSEPRGNRAWEAQARSPRYRREGLPAVARRGATVRRRMVHGDGTSSIIATASGAMRAT